MILVYTQGLKGPCPELWPEMILDMSGKPKPHLSKYEIKDEEAKLPLDELAAIYPAPVMVEAES